MTLQRIEMNVQTGERKVIDLTPQEEADAWARTAEEAAKPVPPKQRTVADLEALLISKGVLTQADVDAVK